MKFKLYKIFFCFFCFFSQSVYSANINYLNFDELASNSEAVVHGTVSSIEGYRDEYNQIRSLITLVDLEYLNKELQNDKITFSQLGGSIASEQRKAHVSGVPKFYVGEEIIVFLSGDQVVSPVVGWGQGLFRISRQNNKNIISDSDNNKIYGFVNDHLLKDIINKPQLTYVNFNPQNIETPKRLNNLNEKPNSDNFIERDVFIEQIKANLNKNKNKNKNITGYANVDSLGRPNFESANLIRFNNQRNKHFGIPLLPSMGNIHSKNPNSQPEKIEILKDQ